MRPPEPAPRPRVLIADDDRLIRMLTRETLLQADFDVIEAVDGREALALFADQPPDLVLLDVDMPHLDGFQVCAAIRARADGAQVPVVMVTGMDDLDSITRAYQSGATDFISKPINWPVLGHRARYALRSAQAMAELRDAEERNSAMLRAIPDMMFALDEAGVFLDFKAGHGLAPMLPPADFLGRSVAEVLPQDVAETVLEGVRQAVRGGELQHIVYSLDLAGARHHYEARVARAGPHRALALVRDISSQKEHEEKIRSLAYYDSLTGLPNRQAFLERLERELRQSESGRLAVLFMDLDGFKRINDTLGHNAGDYLLQSVAARLKDGLRDSDIVARAVSEPRAEIFARLGGDEFTVILPNIRDTDAVGVLADRIRTLVGKPFVIHGQEIVVTASIGIAVYPDDGHDAATLLKHADTAMYQAKDEGRNNWKTYSSALTTRALHRLEIESSLRRALERDEFCLYFQPQFRAGDGRIASVEALVRWNHPERGLVPPAEFIPVAEEGALIIPLGGWVLREALRQVGEWHRGGFAGLRVAVNLSGRQLRDPGFVESVLQTLAATGFDGSHLELELTETILMDSTETTIGRLRQLSEAGVHFSIDDFGTGYSSMGYLKRFPIELLKIDRSFVQGLPGSSDDVAIATAIISMAHSLQLEVVAEGVETPAQAEFLRRAGCDKLQGYLFSMPQPAAKLPALLAAQAVRAA